MNPNQISPDDPRLTLFALGEMEPREQAEFARLLEADTAARQAVDDIRATAATLTSVLEQETAWAEWSEAGAQRKAAILPGGPHGQLDGGGLMLEKLKKGVRFPQMYFAISGLAAACFAVFFVLWQSGQQNKQQTHLIEMPLTAAKEAKDDKSMNAALPVASQPAVTIGRTEALNMPVPEPAPAMVAIDTFGVGEAGAQASTRAVESDRAEQMARQAYAGAMKMKAAPAPRMAFAGGGVSAERDFNTEAYGYRKDNAYLRVADHPLSTFSVDVDTASYANVRRFLAQKQLPPADAVRIEELVNYFPYAYRPPTGNVPFAASLEVASAPWAPEHRLVRIGLKGREVSDAARPAANLVFLLDVSGSMAQPNKLPLVKQSLRLLVNKLRPDDRVAIAVYAGASGLALPSTSAREQAKILDAIEQLDAGGSTNGAMGIHLAYDVAKANFLPGGVNRVILATDGDFNVGTTSEGELVRLIEEKAKGGVFLSVLGFGMGNYKDSTLEQLADKGNGNYAYIDSLAEAKKTLVEQAGGTLVTIAKDVKIQVEFNPLEVQAYRLIGYENRLLAKEDFNNDQVDAGDIGAGHTVTALYEVVPVGVEMEAAPGVDPLKYQRPAGHQESRSRLLAGRDLSGPAARQTEMLTVKIRYKEPAGDVSSKLEFALVDSGARFEEASEDFKFAAAVAGFGMVLRDSPHKGQLTLASVTEWGRAGIGSDAGGYRSEFLSLVGEAASLLH